MKSVVVPLAKSVVEPLVTALRDGMDTPDDRALSESGDTADVTALRGGVEVPDAPALMMMCR